MFEKLLLLLLLLLLLYICMYMRKYGEKSQLFVSCVTWISLVYHFHPFRVYLFFLFFSILVMFIKLCSPAEESSSKTMLDC